MKRIALLLALTLTLPLLAACDPADNLDQATIKTICKALVGSIRYNSTSNKHFRYAGKVLVLDLKQRNQVWDGLHCPSVLQVQKAPAKTARLRRVKG